MFFYSFNQFFMCQFLSATMMGNKCIYMNLYLYLNIYILLQWCMPYKYI